MPDLLSRIAAEIDDRLEELRPAVEEREQLLEAATALGIELEGAATPRRRGPAARTGAGRGRPPRAARTASSPRVGGSPRGDGAARGTGSRGPRGATQSAIIAALEHGSHTVSELVVVTAHSAPSIRAGLRALVASGAIARAQRAGKSAYALTRPPA